MKSLERSDVPVALAINFKKAHVVSVDLTGWDPLLGDGALEKILTFLFNVS